jgi:enoyl-CoA hydratase
MSQGHSDRLIPDPEKRFFSGLFKPVIAAVHGHCLGGGLEIMLGSDMRIASSSATFGLTETRWGSIPGGGSHIRLPGQIPYAVAMQMLLTGEPIDAERAREVGLVNEVVPSSDVLNRAREIAEMISRGAPLAVQTAKRIAVYARSEQRGFALEHALGESVLRSEDCREGPRAFAEGRAPVFRGR